ncbi:disease resistance protein RGA4-like [Triticum dicoccoides]|uniref:disease resistance protein RGA4-like n=1 Tax=Triticum dicoccoides TaxID=85692 RepID=UPI000E7AC93A|nr:disease resistance protein RGA4-like [Triticum dicoccoides]XP_037436876.1 disease resistance protein RGA4-like [Triticum dicoccoides]
MEVAVVVGPIVKLLPKLLSVIDGKRKQLDNLEVDAGFIRRDLQSIQEIIGRSSGGRSITDLWVRDLRRLADDMEDCIDRFQVGKMGRVRFVGKIGRLKKRSKETLEQLQNSISITGAAAPPAPAGGGNDQDPEGQLLALLPRSPSEGRLKVISVAGFGGAGMTRLAHKVYSNRDVRSQFPLHAWVRASPGMSVHKLLQKIHDQLLLISIAKNHGATASSSKIIPQVNGEAETDRGLIGLLKTGRYLIVIDGVNTHELYDVLSAFSWADGVDCRIIMTTAIQLPEATCCRCGNGSSLAMDSTSQVFIGELTESGFVEACLHLRDDTIERIRRGNNEILSSPVVQDLLLYFCMFPRDHPVRRNPLIRRWLAEGLVFPQPETESFSQDVAAKNLESLISRNVIQPIQVRNYGNVKRCQTFGMMLNSISSKSKSQNFITMLCGSGQTTERNPPGKEIRRLSLHLNGAANGPLNLPKELSRLHTLAVFPDDANVSRHQANLNYAKYKLLRVLDLKECADVKAEHVGKICDLLLLKYLSLGDSIDKVPRKIVKLKWLETLDMRRTQVVTLPIEVLQLPGLKHLLGKFQLVEGDCTQKKLEKLLSKDIELHRLSGFVTDKSEGFAQLMSRMGKLRKVKIWCDSTADVTKLVHVLGATKKFIGGGLDMTRVDRSLSIDFQGCPTECSEQFMDSLKATGRLTSLKLRGKLTQLPQFRAKLNYIEELCLSKTSLSGDTILSSLSGLKMTLKYFKLVEDKLGHLVIKPEHFRSLKGLCLVGEQSLEDISIQDEAMPYLVSLHILCEAQGDLPGIDITRMGRLKEVALHSGVQDTIKDGWQAAAMNHPNRPNVLFIHHANSLPRDSPPCEATGEIVNRTKPIGRKFTSSIMGGIFSRARPRS